MKMYMLNSKNPEIWGTEAFNGMIISEEEVNMLAYGWNKSINELLEELEEVNKSIDADDNMRYRMHWETDDCADALDFDTIEEAKDDAIETLINWLIEQRRTYPIDLKDWSEEQIEDWDYMIYNCCVSVRDKTLIENPDYDYGEIWTPSYDDEKEIGWMTYDELIKLNILI